MLCEILCIIVILLLWKYNTSEGMKSDSSTPADLSLNTYYGDFSYPTTAAVIPLPLDPTATGDDEFESSRARMGACVTKKQSHRRQDYIVRPYDIAESSKIDLKYREFTGSQGYQYRDESQ